MTLPALDVDRVRRRLARLYDPPRADACLERIVQRVAEDSVSATSGANWDQRDVVLITYADQLQSPEETPLETLRQFLLSAELQPLFTTVHLLPFFPYSSDDGFSVIDYRQVDPHTGTWDDVQRLGQGFHLMFDLVLNHVSQHSRWFQDYLVGQSPFDRYFIECDPSCDLSQVTRPRSLPVLTEFRTSRGARHVWTTFSPDQVDLNFGEPAVLLEMLEVLLDYVRRGARIIRLDAIAYLWKQVGTSCIHLPQTHEVVKLLRDVLQAVAPQTLLLTETNVPHLENVSYFGQGDEAHMVYQFSLPPLLLDAFVHQDAQPIARWLSQLDPPPDGATYFNFTASHDGIGVRPLEGLVTAQRLDHLLQHVQQQGGLISERVNEDGSHSAYELNITYLDALAHPRYRDPQDHARRFLASQAVMLGLQGIPGVYFHSLVGSQNDLQAVEITGHNRRINRHKYFRDEIDSCLNRSLLQQSVFDGYRHLLRQRIAQPAFHPDGKQEVIPVDHPAVLVFQRTAPVGPQRIIVATNFGDEPCDLSLSQLQTSTPQHELISQQVAQGDRLTLAPSTTVWISNTP